MPESDDFEKAWSAIQSLAKEFSSNEHHYLSPAYQEAEVRKDFIDKFFKALGWDVDHEREHDPWQQEIKIEKSERKSKGRADYAFSLAPHYRRVRFFVEAKRPQSDIATPDNCFQAIRYSWPKGVPISVLMDFNTLHLIDSRYRPNINTATSRVVRTWHYTDYAKEKQFAEIYWLLSREAVASGSIENFVENELPTPQVATRQYTLFAGEAREFDEDFLQKLDEWREALAGVFKQCRRDLTGKQLTECVQRTLDRLVFIRFLEDKFIEPDRIIEGFGRHNKTHWHDFVEACKRLDQIYNGIVFKHHPVLDDNRFKPEGAVFADICDEITDEHSPYNFDSIPVEILGRIYERFLGKIVLAKRNTVEVVDKPDVRKAGGVYYTPDYIVAHMVEQALGPQVKDKKPEEIIKLRAIDIACGSGSFLIGVFAYLLDAIGNYWRKRPKVAKKGVLEERDGELHLSLKYRREILVNCIYGIDIDEQAVEVAQLSLYLKLMEDETTYSALQQQREIGAALLPSLATNIVVANSLLSLEGNNQDLFSVEKQDETKALDFKATFSDVFKHGGFDLVIGNPPYIKEYTNREAFDYVRNSPYYQGKMDIWYMFACRGLDWLKPKTGTIAYIATNNWVTNAGAKKLRAKITQEARIERLIDFGDFKVFRDAGIQTMIFILRKDDNLHSYQFDFRRLTSTKPTLLDAHALLEKTPLPCCEYLTPMFDRNRVPQAPLTFAGGGIEALLDKLVAKKTFEFTEAEVGVGIDVHQDFVNARTQAELRGSFAVGQGIFNLSHREKKTLGLNRSEQTLVKPFYTTNELGRYYGNSKNSLWVIYTDSRFSNPSEMAPYPNLKRHLDQFKKIITSDNHPYGLHRARDEKFFLNEKIISLRKCLEPCFTYTDFTCYVSQTFNVIKTERANLLFLTGLLNSRLVRFWLKHRGKMQGQNFQVDKEPLLAIPLCVPSKREQDRIAKLVAEIIEAKDKMSATTITEAQRSRIERIDSQLDARLQIEIESLYGLDDAERRLLGST